MLSNPAARSLPRALGFLALSTVLALSGCGIPGLPGATGAPERVSAAVVERVPVAAVDQALTLESPPAEAPDQASSTAAATTRGALTGLAGGSQTHRLGAAAHTLIIDYWTTENMSEWTTSSTPIINLTAHIDGAATGEAIRVTRFEARLAGSDTTLAFDTGSFSIEPPYAYSSGVVVPANPSGSSRIIFTIDLLTETAPASGIFTRQTVIDSLTVG